MAETRRAFLSRGTLVLGGLAAAPTLAARAQDGDDIAPKLTIGAVTDVHYADKDIAGVRHYRASMARLERAVEVFNERQVDIALELGDLIDAADDVEDEIAYLHAIDAVFAKADAERHYVLGNHCVDMLTKAEFIGHCDALAPHYSFDRNGVHIVVLDACFNTDGEPHGRKHNAWTDAFIPDDQMTWLEADLARAAKPTVVFIHHRLDATTKHSPANHAEVRAVLEASGVVAAVFSGHAHLNHHVEIGGIHYVTLHAMVDGPDVNRYSIISVHDDGSIAVEGFGEQVDYDLT